MTFDIYTESYNQSIPEMLFMADSDLEMDNSTPFLPMPIKNIVNHYNDF